MDDNKTYNIKIGSMIAKMRADKNMSQRDLADAAGIDKAHIARIEQGKYSIRIDILYKIATGLNCSAKDILPD